MLDKIYFRTNPVNKINLADRNEVKYWSRAMGVSEDDLHDICARVGQSVTSVRSSLLN